MSLSAAHLPVHVLIPARDEEESLPHVLAVLPEWIHTVVVVDNGSADETPERAREAGATVVSEPRRGYGSACLAGLRHLAGHAPQPSIVVFVDADHDEAPRALADLVRPIRDGHADLVLGSRTSTDGGQGVPWHARWGNRLVLGWATRKFGRRFTDVPPFRAVTWPALRRLEMDDRDWGWTLQMQIRAVIRGLRVVEVPVAHGRRRRGRSKISGSLLGSVRAGVKMLFTLAREAQ